MIERALSLVARLSDLFARQPEPIAIPIRRDDLRGPVRSGRRI